MAEYKINRFQKSRIATIDAGEIGQKKHHIAAIIEIDVTESRRKIKKYRKEINKISFTAWLIKAISLTVKDHEKVAAFLQGKRKLIIFNDINIIKWVMLQ
jgi:pyruvate/2-oxoglutarate dehydrogenase complex dihydrolipoamide acyltransferase (E2) component